MTDTLRERVAKAMCDAVNVEGTWEETGTLHREKVWFVAADAAIALVLEEAARVASGMWIIGHGNLNANPYHAAKQVGDEIAAAIRALKEDGDA